MSDSPLEPARHARRWLFTSAAALAAAGCADPVSSEPTASTTKNAPGVMSAEKTFQEDVDFLKKHAETIVLKGKSGDARVAVTPAYQGRVMTSSATGGDGVSFGWINYSHVESGEVAEHINVYGGEERFWLGPEGGQFSIYFAPGAKFEFADWQTPAPIDTEPFDVTDQSDTKVSFKKETELTNYSGTKLSLRIDRDVEVISADDASGSLGVDPGKLNFVGYRTVNKVTNTGDTAWTKETGMLSIWLLGMYKPGPETTIVVPFKPGPEEELGVIVNDEYFGKVPADRLKVQEDVLYLSADGKHRSKIGLPPRRAKDVAGSFDAERDILTIVKYSKPGDEVTDYVNSMWEIQDEPFAGDTINAYNDGSPEPGAPPLGPFYEIETSSPALALEPGKSGEHVSETYHFQGDRSELDRVAQAVLGVSLEEIEAGLE
ncbi:DUF6786 family protein [Botrimarina mediterranea]|uniref:Uncharacterized protein n=1 Tax=Botrimarina mediterranea TaxID=2528022 RepID=A0A518K968_9BACT|nr:DUF6786 family protein [Botrimarina mediterranea]QDV74341.1 hypothetical protein Spa11_25440 [Botrimarina mediterranea]QDV78937.1 hypothetical protein K2D_25460 [Planctomycetes bacterium K2D]